ncbi:MAG: cobyric acid synthase [Candidatus Binataceae bacterium]
MIQGTASSVGKSLLTAALCRIFRQDGLRVAPFKAQNMALNSAVTPAGDEIGRAQAVQAEAAGVPATVEMNPILLKPEGGMRSQVVILGKSAGSMTWNEYQRMRPDLVRIVDDCIARLRREFEVVVIEGAGSPAEINLRSQDLVNMHVAAAADAPVILAGDIDRGGVFAQLVGTMELLPPEERARIAGFVINKFRGDPALLKTGLDYLEARYHLPVLGVVPFVEQLRIAEEDSVGLESRSRRKAIRNDDLEIAVVKLPSISNYDDFSALEHEPGVTVSYITSPIDARNADLLILPGSKSTVRDLKWLERKFLIEPILERPILDRPTLGICGGCQMMGMKIEDPDRVESQQREIQGLCLLPIVTRFERTKRITQVRARIDAPSFLGSPEEVGEIDGYEIHMGRTSLTEPAGSPFRILCRNGEPCDAPDGAINPLEPIVGTMLHGIFENDRLRAAMLARLREQKSLGDRAQGPAVASRDAEYDRLADVVRAAVDIAAVKRIARIG